MNGSMSCRRSRCCKEHALADVVLLGGVEKRFCQQCCGFHDIGLFDGKRRCVCQARKTLSSTFSGAGPFKMRCSNVLFDCGHTEHGHPSGAGRGVALFHETCPCFGIQSPELLGNPTVTAAGAAASAWQPTSTGSGGSGRRPMAAATAAAGRRPPPTLAGRRTRCCCRQPTTPPAAVEPPAGVRTASWPLK